MFLHYLSSIHISLFSSLAKENHKDGIYLNGKKFWKAYYLDYQPIILDI